MRTVRLALEVWGNDYQQLVDTAQAAEALGFDALYYGEAPHGLNLETWSALAAVAAQTTTIRLGPVITNLLPAYRSFPLLIRQAHALAVISGDRLDVRTGTGAARSWARPWWEPVGVDYPARAERRRLLEEWLAAYDHVWSAPGKPFSSPGLGFDELRLVPAVARPPLTVAAAGPRSMAIAARHADVWEASYLTPGELRPLVAQIDRLAAAAGRALSRSVEVDLVTAPTEAERRSLEADFLAGRGGAGPAALAKALTGPPERLAAQMAAFVAAGADQLLLAGVDPHHHGALETVARAAALGDV